LSRFLADRTVFYDGYGNEMGRLSNRELIIDGIVCRGNLYVGDFVIDTTYGFEIKPSGRTVI
jgi:hypothetical protein